MPLHVIYYPPNLWTNEEKAELVDRITTIYTNPPAELPAFWVNVIFRPTPAEDFFIGGRGPSNNYVRIAVDHIARPLDKTTVGQRNFMNRYWQAIEPFTKGKGVGCEVSIDHTPSELWSIDGLRPPYAGTKEEVELRNLQRKENKIVLDKNGSVPLPSEITW